MELNFKPAEESEIDYSPQHLMLVGPPKIGKSTVLSALPGHGILNIEPNGVDGYRFLKKYAVTMQPTNMNDLRSLAMASYKYSQENGGKKPYEVLVIDTMDVFEEWAAEQATYDYMADAKGKDFNRWKAEDLKADPSLAAKFKPGDEIPRSYRKYWRRVDSLPRGAGYYWIREAFKTALNLLPYLSDRVIYVCHIRDKFLEKEGVETTIRTTNLSGQLGPILAGMCEACAFLSRKGNKLVADFTTDDNISGCRNPKLDGKSIVISEKSKDGKITVDWSQIYPFAKPVVFENL